MEARTDNVHVGRGVTPLPDGRLAQCAIDDLGHPLVVAVRALICDVALTVPARPPPAHRRDWTIDQGWDAYTSREHQVWMPLYERQTKLLPGRACDAFLQGFDALDLHRGGIPDFNRINEELTRLTGWSVVA